MRCRVVLSIRGALSRPRCRRLADNGIAALRSGGFYALPFQSALPAAVAQNRLLGAGILPLLVQVSFIILSTTCSGCRKSVNVIRICECSGRTTDNRISFYIIFICKAPVVQNPFRAFTVIKWRLLIIIRVGGLTSFILCFGNVSVLPSVGGNSAFATLFFRDFYRKPLCV